MKKVSLFFAMVFVVTFAMAQNTANIDQIGNNNSDLVTQTGNNLLNGDQIGNWNEATVSQEGSNEALFEQGAGEHSGVDLTSGNENQLTVLQDGASNDAKVWEYYSKNISSVTQIGDNNYANQWIWAANENEAIISQTGGNHNYARIAMNGLGGFNEGVITQEGYRNHGAIGQGWSGVNHGGNIASIEQVGNWNRVDLEDFLVAGTNNPGGYTDDLVGMGVQQYGSDNLGRVTQDGDYNKAAIWQFGDGNTGVLVQNTSDYGKAVLVQVGFDNAAKLTQSYGSDADILQEGDDNVLKGVESWNSMATSLGGSTLDLDQLGDGNVLRLEQSNGGTATVLQDGITNTSQVIQN